MNYQIVDGGYHGQCPLCGHYSKPQDVKEQTGMDSIHWMAATKNGTFTGMWCGACEQFIPASGKRTYWKPGKGKLRNYYQREAQLKTTTGDWVDYGVLTRLQEKSGTKLPGTWRGNVDALADDLGMNVEEVAANWNKNPKTKRARTVEELRDMGEFDVSR